jgi:2-methylcitrate dehydratase PrpD
MQYAHYAVEQRARTLSDTERNALRRVLMDWLGCALAGARCEPVPQLCVSQGISGSHLLLDGRLHGARNAALVNATAAHALELDDIYRDGLYHPGAPVIAAALALSEARDASVGDLLQAILIGYEISTRLATAINPAHYRLWHTTGTVGCIGAAAASASLLGCDSQAFGHALATATTFASGLQQAFRSAAMTKPLHAGHAAETGVWTAQAAAAGVTGALDIFEGEAGFGVAMSNDPDWSVAVRGLGDHCNTADITFKAHACCGQTFAAVDAMISLRGSLLPEIDNIRCIEIETYRQAIAMASDPAPREAAAARFSLPYVVAIALSRGEVGVSAFDAQSLIDPVVVALMAKVTLKENEAIERCFPSQRSALVRVKLADGRVFEHFQLHRKGDPEEPLSDTELEAKFFSSANLQIRPAVAHALLDGLRQLDCDAKVASLLSPLRNIG